jgi:TolA-binding protein
MKAKRNKWAVRFVICIFSVLFMAAFVMAEQSAYDKAVKAYVKRDYLSAAKYLKEYVEKKPDPYAYYLLGYSLYKTKHHAESVKYFGEAYILDPDISPSSVKKEISKKKR